MAAKMEVEINGGVAAAPAAAETPVEETNPIVVLMEDMAETTKATIAAIDAISKEIFALKTRVLGDQKKTNKTLVGLKKKYRTRKSRPGRPTAFDTPKKIKPELLRFLRKPVDTQLTRIEAHKLVVQELERRNLRVDPNKANKFKLTPDLQTLFSTEDTVTTNFTVNKHITKFIESSSNKF